MTAIRRKRLTERQDDGPEVVQSAFRGGGGVAGSVKLVPIASLRLDGGTQPRASIHVDWIEEYALDMAAGGTFPAVTVFFDGTDHWLADGFHRAKARQVMGDTDIECDVRQGSQRDAVLFSCSANATHGQRRTNDDKRRSVLCLLHDPEWSQLSDGEIARRCAVTQQMVSGVRPRPTADTHNGCEDEQRTFIHPKTGKSTKMKTGNIGRRPTPEVPQPADEPDDDPPAAATSAPRQPSGAQANFEATLRAQGAWADIAKAVRAIAELPPPDAVIEVVMQTTSHGEQFEIFESAIAWLNGFLPLYREAEPRRWQLLQERLGDGTTGLATASSTRPESGKQAVEITSIDGETS